MSPATAFELNALYGDANACPSWLGEDAERACPGMRVLVGRPDPTERPETAHAETEIAIPCGDAQVEIAYQNGNGRTHHVAAAGHHVSIIPAGQPHAVCWRRKANLVVVFLEPGFLAGVAADQGMSGEPCILEHYAQVDPFVRQLGLSFLDGLRPGHGPVQLHLGSIACVLAMHLLNHYTPARRKLTLGGLPKHLLGRAVEFIHANLAEDLTLDELARAVGLSPFYFARLFKQATGLGPHRYVMQCRIERAKELLRHSDQPIVDVALAAGFADQSHLTEVFRRLTGTTPSVFRQQLRS